MTDDERATRRDHLLSLLCPHPGSRRGALRRGSDCGLCKHDVERRLDKLKRAERRERS